MEWKLKCIYTGMLIKVILQMLSPHIQFMLAINMNLIESRDKNEKNRF